MSSEAGDSSTPVASDKTPRTARGRRTHRAILDAAAAEFGERGFHAASINQITTRAGVAIGSFYTYFDSKEAVFTALVRDLSGQVRDFVSPHMAEAPDGLAREQNGLTAFITFVRAHKEIYRIIDEAEFVDPDSYRLHYRSTADRIAGRLKAAAAQGEIAEGPTEIWAWAIMGMNVFLGLRYGVWSEDAAPEDVAAVAGELLATGIRSEALRPKS
jgi:AcrR family transcriptional regulator